MISLSVSDLKRLDQSNPTYNGIKSEISSLHPQQLRQSFTESLGRHALLKDPERFLAHVIAFIRAECRHFFESFRNGIHALRIEFPSVHAILDQLLGRSDIVTREDRQSGRGRLIQHESPRFLKRRMNEATRASVKLRKFLDLAETGEEDGWRAADS